MSRTRAARSTGSMFWEEIGGSPATIIASCSYASAAASRPEPG